MTNVKPDDIKDNSESEDDYPEAIVNSSDFRKEIYEFDSQRDLNIIRCIGQIESQYDYQVEHEYKVSCVGTGTVYNVSNDIAFILSCAHNIRHKIYVCSQCNTYNRKKICSKCSEALTVDDKKIIKPTYIEFKRRIITPNQFGYVQRSYTCDEIYVPHAYETNTVMKRGFDFAVLSFRDDGYYDQNCNNIVLDNGTKILKTYQKFSIFGYPGFDTGNVKKNKLYGSVMKSNATQHGIEITKCEEPQNNYKLKTKYMMRQRHVDTSGGQSGSAVFVTSQNNNKVIIFAVHIGGHEKEQGSNNDYSYNQATLLSADYIMILQNVTRVINFKRYNLVKSSKPDCLFGYDDNDGIDRADIGCPQHHSMTALSMYQYIVSTLEQSNKAIQIQCPMCKITLDWYTCAHIADMNQTEYEKWTTLIDQRRYGKVQPCPNCKMICERKTGFNAFKMKCNCNGSDWCWECGQSWKSKGSNIKCGNYDCKYIDEINLILKNAIRITPAYMKQVKMPEIRACPCCLALIQFQDACKHMMCRECNGKFCFVCLGIKDQSGGFPCGSYKSHCLCAPVQKFV